MTAVQTPETMTPKAVDTELARIWNEQQKLVQRLQMNESSLEHHRSGKYHYGFQFEERTVAEIAKLIADLKVLTAEATPFEVEFDTRRWNRYFLVTNTNGHVHRGMDCNTCFPTTLYAWLPELSGCDEAEMIVEFGEMACTICFPDAPANPAFHAPGRRDAAAKAERAAEKAEKQALKDAKAITAPDGSPLKVDGWVIKTKVAAQRELSKAVQDFSWYGPGHPSDFLGQIKILVAALEAAGIETDGIIARASKKVAKDNMARFPLIFKVDQ